MAYGNKKMTPAKPAVKKTPVAKKKPVGGKIPKGCIACLTEVL